MLLVTRRFLVSGAIAAVLVSAATASPQAPPSRSASLTLTILHTNDLHGHVLPFAYTEAAKGPTEQPSVGGAARRATLIRTIRASLHNPSLVVDSGDTFTRGPLTTTYEGTADVEAMNAVGYDMAAVGNNEFKARDAVDADDAAGAQAALLRVVARARFPWLCANALDEHGAPLRGVHPYIIREIAGVRIGFLGLTAPRSATYPQTRGWTITDPVAAAKEWIPRARAECDLLIAVTHIGVDLDRAVAEQTSGLDAIVGGDSHTFLYQAVEAKNTEGRMVPIVQTGEFGVYLGRFDLRFARDASGRWSRTGYDYRLIKVGPELREAPDVASVVGRYTAPMMVTVGDVGAIAATPAGRSEQTTRLLCDALRAATGATVALNHAGEGFFEVLRHRAVSRYDLYAAMPFHNNAVVAELSGAELQAALQKGPAPVTSPPGVAITPQGRYRVAMVDFEATSFYGIPEARLTPTGRDIREIVEAYLRSRRRAAGTALRANPPSRGRGPRAVARRTPARPGSLAITRRLAGIGTRN
jgi:5'-nucleotidase